MDISTWIERHAGFSRDKTAIRFVEDEISYGDLAARIGDIAGVLRHRLGIKRGDRIAWLGFNHSDLIALVFACARLGAIVVPLNWRLEGHECRTLLEDCTPKALIVGAEFVELGDQICEGLNIPVVGAGSTFASAGSLTASANDTPPVSENEGEGRSDDPVLISYTSGTTGKPKGVLIDQNAIFINAVNSIHMHGLTSDDVVLGTLPLFHVGGLNILSLPTLRSGGTLVLHPVFDVGDTYDTIRDDKVTLTVLVPTQISALMSDNRWQSDELASLRMMTTGSSMVPGSLIRKVHARGVPLIQVYGSTETAPIATYLTADLAKANEGSAGLVAIHCEMRIIDGSGAEVRSGESGEILIRGENLMREYWNKPEATARALVDGWFYTGDIGHVDEAGFLYVDDRQKDMIICGGENIYPAELENVLVECPDIAEVAVIGQKDEKWGEIVVAVVVAADGSSLTDSEVTGYLEGKLARFKHPRRVVFVENLPRNTMGKVVKDDLRAMVNQTQEPKEQSAG